MMRRRTSPEEEEEEDGEDDGRRSGHERIRKFGRETLMPVLAVVAIMVPLRSAVADWNDVPSGSMRPTILEGDRIWVNKLAYGLRVPLTMSWLTRWDVPSRGDIVTMASPDDGIRLVKRIIGVPGDRISMTGNRLTINGSKLKYKVTDRGLETLRPHNSEVLSYIKTEELGTHPHAVTTIPSLAGQIDSFDEFIVPDGHYFFLGDNRDQSRDSRFIGPVALDQIFGRVSHIALSVDPERYYRPRFERWLTPLDAVGPVGPDQEID